MLEMIKIKNKERALSSCLNTTVAVPKDNGAILQTVFNRINEELKIWESNLNNKSPQNERVLAFYTHYEAYRMRKEKIAMMELKDDLRSVRRLYKSIIDGLIKYGAKANEELGILNIDLVEIVSMYKDMEQGDISKMLTPEEYLSYISCYTQGNICPENMEEYKLIYCGDCRKVKLTIPTDSVNGMVCEECANDHYKECSRCGEAMDTRDETMTTLGDRIYCNECLEQLHDEFHVIQDGYYELPLIFQPADLKSLRYMGTENEVIMADGFDYSLFYECDQINEFNILPTQDGTITEGMEEYSIGQGIEFITQPMGLDIHDKEIVPFLRYIERNGAICGKSGLHIHVDRRATSLEVFKLIELFIEAFQEEFLLLSRREEFGEYCKPKSEVNDKLSIKREKCDKTDRYHLVNFQNRNTVEFRFFNSTVDEDEYMASLFIIDSLISYFEAFDVDNDKFTFKRWAEFATKDNLCLRDYFLTCGIDL